MLPGTIRSPSIPHRLNLNLSIYEAEIQFVNKPAIAALLFKAAPGNGNPLAV